MDNKKAWMIYEPDLKKRPKNNGDAHYVEVQFGNRNEFDSSWKEFVLIPKRKIKRKRARG